MMPRKMKKTSYGYDSGFGRQNPLFFLQNSLLHQSYHLPGQFTPGAYGSSRLYGRIADPEFTEPLSAAARDCDFTALFVSVIRLAAKLGPDIASNSAAVIATT